MTIDKTIHSLPCNFLISGSAVHDSIDLTIVIPCLNEAENFVGILDSVRAAVAG